MNFDPSSYQDSQKLLILAAAMQEAKRRGIRIKKPEPPQRPILPPKFQGLWTKARHKFYYGGRDSAKSWSIARSLVWRAHTEQHRILCTREYQSSIKHSVHKLLKDQIANLGLIPYFHITNNSIIAKQHGSEFLFKGIHEDPDEIKSTEGITIGWLEEAERTSPDSLKILLATIRKAGSEIIASWNPEEENSAIDTLGRKKLPPDSISEQVSWRDNPFRSPEMELLRQYQQQHDPDNYDWIWEGAYRKITHASIFGRKYSVEEFEAPEGVRLFYGADWGFANDPTVLIRFYIHNECLYIEGSSGGSARRGNLGSLH